MGLEYMWGDNRLQKATTVGRSAIQFGLKYDLTK
jgi:hypothetical protein